MSDQIWVTQNHLHALHQSFENLMSQLELTQTFNNEALKNLEANILSLGCDTLQSIEGGLTKLVADAAHKTGKKATLTTIGFDHFKVDQLTLTALRRCLVHAVRNSVSHGFGSAHRDSSPELWGIEINLQAAWSKGALEVTITDQGNGPDWGAIKRRALSQGLINAEQSEWDDLPPRDRLEIIFKEGFSTRDKASQLSGRGMGLSSVREEIRELGGLVWAEAPAPNQFCLKIRVHPKILGLQLDPQSLKPSPGNNDYWSWFLPQKSTHKEFGPSMICRNWTSQKVQWITL